MGILLIFFTTHGFLTFHRACGILLLVWTLGTQSGSQSCCIVGEVDGSMTWFPDFLALILQAECFLLQSLLILFRMWESGEPPVGKGWGWRTFMRYIMRLQLEDLIRLGSGGLGLILESVYSFRSLPRVVYLSGQFWEIGMCLSLPPAHGVSMTRRRLIMPSFAAWEQRRFEGWLTFQQVLTG